MPLYRSGTFSFAATHSDLGELAGEDPEPFTFHWPIWFNLARILPWLVLAIIAALCRTPRLIAFLLLLCVIAWLAGVNDATLSLLFAWSYLLLLAGRFLPLPREKLVLAAALGFVGGSMVCFVLFSSFDASFRTLLPTLIAALMSSVAVYGALARSPERFGPWRFAFTAGIWAFAIGAIVFNIYSSVVILNMTRNVLYLVGTVISTTILAAVAALAIAALLRAALGDPAFAERVRQQVEKPAAHVAAAEDAES